MINAKDAAGCQGSRARASQLRREKSCRHTGEDGLRRKSVKVGHADSTGEARDFRPLPFDGKCDRRIAQDAEVESIMGVLPNVFAGEDQIFSDGLLQAGMELVAP